MVESSSQLWLTIKAGCSGDGSMNSTRGREIVLPVGGDGDKDGMPGSCGYRETGDLGGEERRGSLRWCYPIDRSTSELSSELTM
jgi:hypothetical protein